MDNNNIIHIFKDRLKVAEKNNEVNRVRIDKLQAQLDNLLKEMQELKEIAHIKSGEEIDLFNEAKNNTFEKL